MRINRGLSIANANSQIIKKSYSQRILRRRARRSDRKVNGWEFIALYGFVSTSILLVASVVLSENVPSFAGNFGGLNSNRDRGRHR